MEKKFYTHSLSNESLIIRFTENSKCLSSAILNGGFSEINSAVILNVVENFEGKKSGFEDPAKTLSEYISMNNIDVPSIGMMTSASMNSFREKSLVNKDVLVAAFLTAGVSNAKRAGDKAEWNNFEEKPYIPGTINIILYTNLNLSKAAMTEAVMIVTEAKAAALQELEILTNENKIATGTGTDSTAIVCALKGKPNNYCGKHTLLGEMIGRAVKEALISSLKKSH